ncbi:MAG TPA: glucose 1-dehydrogenase [Myxococcota bacterium]|nr:glucose 1-dehydrogenase [Myxococcota bacterium]HRY94598.1 glucose 1-dehydrogenase [Myxococcota bacterium]HSA20320.1 glucose 1-dehydrogenase [Myxococcota bacterium]
MSSRLQGKLCLVTGGSRGIGEAIATACVREGARVIIASRKLDGLEAAKVRIAAAGPGPVHACVCHLGELDQIEELTSSVFEEIGVPDVLVNNAATNPYFGPMLDVEEAAWQKTFEVNVRGPFELTRRVARRWRDGEKPGVIVNVASILGLRAAPLQGVYGLTKAAIISMTQTLAVELAPFHIRVNAVAPGLVDTKFASALVGSPDIVKVFTDHTAQKRYAQPAEIAGAVVFLASDEAAYVTGQVLCVDGGYTVA